MKAFLETREEKFLAQQSRGFSFALHLHPQLELLLVRSGELTVYIRNQAKTLTAGSLAVIFPNQIHSYDAADLSESHITMVISDLAYTGGYAINESASGESLYVQNSCTRIFIML